VTSAQAIKRLTPAQRRFYVRLQGHRGPGLYASRQERRSADALVRLGWAEVAPVDAIGVHYRLTDLGKLIAGPIAFTWPEAVRAELGAKP